MFLRAFFFVLLLGLSIPALTVAVVDPFQIWHDRWLGQDVYSTNQRFQNAGLIRKLLECNDCSDAAVIVGTSVSENTSQDDIRATTGLQTAVRLIAKGSGPVEHQAMLRRALGSGRVKTLYWEMYRNYLKPDYAEPKDPNIFPGYLYNSTRLDDYPYLLNHNVFTDSLRIVSGTASEWTTDLNRLNSWQDDALRKNRFVKWNAPNMVATMTNRVEPRRILWSGSAPDWDHPAPVFEEYILPIVDEFPTVEFVFFTPPVSLIRHGEEIGDLVSGQFSLRAKLAALAEQRGNVTVFNFDDFYPLVTDMAFYKDTAHFTETVNRWMLERMTAGDQRFRLTTANVVERSNELWQRIIEHLPYSSCEHEPQLCGIFDSAQVDPGRSRNP